MPRKTMALAFLAMAAVLARSYNAEEIGTRLRDRYYALVESGAIDFADTDLPYGGDGDPVE